MPRGSTKVWNFHTPRHRGRLRDAGGLGNVRRRCETMAGPPRIGLPRSSLSAFLRVSSSPLHLIRRALALRARLADAFGPFGAYTPLAAGPGVCAFTRGIAEALVVAPVRGWQDVAIDAPEGLRGRWRCALTGEAPELGETVAVAALIVEPYGVALLERA